MITIARFAAETILPFIGLGKPPLQLEGYRVKASSTRLECFRQNQRCVTCDKVGNLFLLQSHKVPRWVKPGGYDNPHLNFYHIGKRGGLTLMTQDHIKPKSRGGSDTLCNLQTMCCNCNQRKGCDYRGPEWE